MEFKKVIAGAFYYVYEYRMVLAKALARPFAAFILVDAAQYLEVKGTLTSLTSRKSFYPIDG